jgi:hypothetical protein
VQIRTDLAEIEPFRAGPKPFQTESAFREAFEWLAGPLPPKSATNLKIAMGSQLTSLVDSESAPVLCDPGLIARLTSYGCTFDTITLLSVAHFGVNTPLSLAALIATECHYDCVVNPVSGQNRKQELTAQVAAAIKRIGDKIIGGDLAAIDLYKRLRQQEAEAYTAEAQLQYRRQAEALEQSSDMGLRFQLERIWQLQTRIRREALSKLVEAEGQ